MLPILPDFGRLYCHTVAMPDVTFNVVLRGYDIEGVDDLIRRANLALALPDPAERTAVERQLRQPGIAIKFRGYDRSQVDRRLAELADQLSAQR